MDRQEAEIKLKEQFGIDHFYNEQWEVISRLLNGEKVLLIERTGFGKSLCYQFPATQLSGVTIIFSPLIALMRDQVKSLQSKGIRAACIIYEQGNDENEKIINQAIAGELKILYISPERQQNDIWRKALRSIRISMVVIDEAHTISTWGHDFRPAFRQIISLVKLLPINLPILATTATATQRVREDIKEQMGGTVHTIRGSLIRENFRLRVIRVKSEDEKMIWLGEHLNRFKGSGIIYAGTRINTEIYAKWLKYVGIDAINYNAGFDSPTRKNVEKGLMDNKWKCIISTNALGMGIDKPDIRFVIHTQMPESPIQYYQEIGRAGRDGNTAHAILFFNETLNEKEQIEEDLLLPMHFINTSRPQKLVYDKVIALLLEEPQAESELISKANINQSQMRVIKSDLMEQGIIKEIKSNGKCKLEYQYDAPRLRYRELERQNKNNLDDLMKMKEYIYTTEPRMKFLCDFLDCDEETEYNNCDNTNLTKITIDAPNPVYAEKLHQFKMAYFPELDIADKTTKTIEINGREIKLSVCVPFPNEIDIIRNGERLRYQTSVNHDDFSKEEINAVNKLLKLHLTTKSHIYNGLAASYYGETIVGGAIRRSKYENGKDFPDFLLKMTLAAFKSKFDKTNFDYVFYVPPTVSGQLVCNFATKFAKSINVPVSHALHKVRQTQEQKEFHNESGKHDNIQGAFNIDMDLNGKNVIIIDDICGSGATLREISKLLTAKGAESVCPIVIAKTIGDIA